MELPMHLSVRSATDKQVTIEFLMSKPKTAGVAPNLKESRQSRMDALTILSWGSWGLKQLPYGHQLVKAARGRLVREPFRRSHGAIHTVRQIKALTEQIQTTPNSTTLGHLETLSERFCTQACDLLASLIAADAAKIHCCVKLIEPGTQKAEDNVRTFVRSSNSGSRGSGDRDKNEVHRAGECSVWSSIHALNDGKNDWSGLPCFSCPDLAAVGDKFVCSRKNWQDRYHATIALPIRYCLDGTGRNRNLIGFLAFDTKEKTYLSDLPNAFDFVNNPEAFESRLLQTPVFDALATITDAFGMALAGLWETPDNVTAIEKLKISATQNLEKITQSTEDNG